MITFLNSGRNPDRLAGLRRMLCLLLIYLPAFVVLILLFMAYLVVVYGQRLFNFAVDFFWAYWNE